MPRGDLAGDNLQRTMGFLNQEHSLIRRASRASRQSKGDRDGQKKIWIIAKKFQSSAGAYIATSSSHEERSKRKSSGGSPRQGIRVQRGASSSDDSLVPDQKEKRMSRRSTRASKPGVAAVDAAAGDDRATIEARKQGRSRRSRQEREGRKRASMLSGLETKDGTQELPDMHVEAEPVDIEDMVQKQVEERLQLILQQEQGKKVAMLPEAVEEKKEALSLAFSFLPLLEVWLPFFP
jgi:hypothetical protein